jgi:uncharacterized protein (TIGR00369 family)
MTTRYDSPSLAAMNETILQVPLHRQMGLRIHEHGSHTRVTMELSEAVSGAVAVPGSIHGGILATFADVSSAAALWGAFDSEGNIPVTTDIHVRYYRQPRSGPLTAAVDLVHNGRRLLSTECAITDAEQRVLARSTATYMIVSIPSSGADA